MLTPHLDGIVNSSSSTIIVRLKPDVCRALGELLATFHSRIELEIGGITLDIRNEQEIGAAERVGSTLILHSNHVDIRELGESLIRLANCTGPEHIHCEPWLLSGTGNVQDIVFELQMP